MARSSLSKNLAKWYHRHVADPLKNLRRQIRRGILHPRLAFGYQAFRRAIEQCRWDDAHARLDELAAACEKARDRQLLLEMGFAAERLGEHEKTTQWQFRSRTLSGGTRKTEWTGEDLSDATLVVIFQESEKQGLAGGLNAGGYVAEAAAKAKHCRLIVEPRLVPIFKRSLSGIDVQAYPSPIEAIADTRLVTANPLTLKHVLGTSAEEIEGRFRPLKADETEITGLREKYQAGQSKPLVGISWWSSHFGKDLPSLDDWCELIRSTNARFVNIQYGDIEADLDVFGKTAPDRFIHDGSVDQLKDMDRFASQLGALDAVVTISNTGAHLAGAMGVPTCLIRDDWFRRAWPVRSDRTPWYPHTKVYGKDGRPWPEVMAKIGERLTSQCKTD